MDSGKPRYIEDIVLGHSIFASKLGSYLFAISFLTAPFVFWRLMNWLRIDGNSGAIPIAIIITGAFIMSAYDAGKIMRGREVGLFPLLGALAPLKPVEASRRHVALRWFGLVLNLALFFVVANWAWQGF